MEFATARSPQDREATMRHKTMKDRVCNAALGMTPDEVRAIGDKLNDFAEEHCPEGSRPDLVIGAAIDHLYAMAAAEKAKDRRAHTSRRDEL